MKSGFRCCFVIQPHKEGTSRKNTIAKWAKDASNALAFRKRSAPAAADPARGLYVGCSTSCRYTGRRTLSNNLANSLTINMCGSVYKCWCFYAQPRSSASATDHVPPGSNSKIQPVAHGCDQKSTPTSIGRHRLCRMHAVIPLTASYWAVTNASSNKDLPRYLLQCTRYWT